MRTLVALPISPFSEMACWALDHHRMKYAYEPYTPMLGEPLLRLRIRRLVGQVTVPVLIEEGRAVIDDSLAIARHADKNGEGTALFPAAGDAKKEEELERWLARGERMLQAGRAVVLRKMSTNRDAQMDSLPRAVPGRLRPALAPMSTVVTRYMARKYDARPGASADDPDVIENLEALREAIRERDTLLGAFSYADVVMACALQFVHPVSNSFMRLTPALRATWTCAEQASKYSDVIDWRDAVYAKHRRVDPEGRKS